VTAQATPASRVVVIGAGPAGLTAAHALTERGLSPLVLERHDKVGGLARTETFHGFHFDMGGHRFFTKSQEVRKLWSEILGPELLRRPRLSRIYYQGRLFNYPLRPLNALRGLGLRQSVLIAASYLWWQLFPCRHVDTFEQWVTNRFGRRLFETFFKTYTEKVWGISCSELKAEWAAQRIKDLSLRTALLSAILKPRRPITTLIEEFDYPRLGPGMLWRAVQERIVAAGGSVRVGAEVVRVCRTGARIDAVVVGGDGGEESVVGTHFLSSMPVTDLVRRLEPPPDPEVLEAANRLTHRAFLTICLILTRPKVFPDNWIYVHSPEVKVGRIQNYKNWSPAMVPDATRTSLGLEYFVNEGDALWSMPDADLVALATRELEQLGLASRAEVEAGCVFRVPHAYPVYDSTYREALAQIRHFVDRLENLQTIGRNGLHRYNNQDHAMLTGLLAVRNLVDGARHDLWAVNTDQQYLEEIDSGARPDQTVGTLERVAVGVFRRLDRTAFGLAVGLAAGLLLWLTTLSLALRGHGHIRAGLGLLAQYFPAYRVTLAGSFVGFGYGLVSGFVGGWVTAAVRNAAMLLYVGGIARWLEGHSVRRLLDYL